LGLDLRVDRGLPLVLADAGSQVVPVLVLRVQLVAVLALDRHRILQIVLVLIQILHSLLQIILLGLHLLNLLGKVLVGCEQLLVLLLVLIVVLLLRRSRPHSISSVECRQKALLELFLFFELIGEYFELSLHGRSFPVPLPFLVITYLRVPTHPSVDLSLQLLDLGLILLLEQLNLFLFALFSPVELVDELLVFLPALVEILVDLLVVLLLGGHLPFVLLQLLLRQMQLLLQQRLQLLELSSLLESILLFQTQLTFLGLDLDFQGLHLRHLLVHPSLELLLLTHLRLLRLLQLELHTLLHQLLIPNRKVLVVLNLTHDGL